MIFLDSSFLISYFFEKEENHPRALELWEGIRESAVISDHILDEVVTFLVGRRGAKVAHESGMKLIGLNSLEVVYSSMSGTLKAMDILRNYEGLSFCDSLSVAIMHEKRIKKIASFDSDFDKIKGLERIY